MDRPGRWLLVLVALAGSPASARDLQRLSELVVPAYAAMSIAILCARDNSDFVTTHTGPRGNALRYAQHVKDEAIDGLTYEEAEEVLKGAAEVARARARAKLHEIANPFDAESTRRAVKMYCESDGKAVVLQAMVEHDRAHEEFLENVRAAKARN